MLPQATSRKIVPEDEDEGEGKAFIPSLNTNYKFEKQPKNGAFFATFVNARGHNMHVLLSHIVTRDMVQIFMSCNHIL